MTSRFPYTKPSFFIIIHCLVWWIMTISAKSALDSYGDMAEVYAWSQHWLMGSSKHPQFLPWMAKLWFFVAPQTVASFYLLSAVNLGVALFGILALGRVLKMGELAVTVALALCVLALPYLTLPGKLNMNSICLSVWPWTVWAFAKALEGNGRSRLLHAMLFGLLAAVSMLSKYYSVVLLIPLFVYTFMPSQRQIWRTITPWLAVVVFLLVSTPHLVWLLNDEDALGYASGQGADAAVGTKLVYILKFLAAPLLYWPVPILIALVLLARGPLVQRVKLMLSPRAMPGLLAFATIGPWLVAILFALTGLVELSMPWAIPLGFAFTLYLVSNAREDLLAVRGPQILSAFRFIWPIMIAVGVGVGVIAGLQGRTAFYEPNEASAIAVVDAWHERSSLPLSWVAKGNDAAAVAFFAPEPVEALPDLPDRLPSYYPPRIDWRNEAGVIFCSLRPAGKVNEACLKASTNWAAEAGLQSEIVTLQVKRTGLRFFRDKPFDMAVVYVWPH